MFEKSNFKKFSIDKNTEIILDIIFDEGFNELLFTNKSLKFLFRADEMEVSKMVSETKLKLEELGIPLSQFFVRDEDGKVLFNRNFIKMIVKISLKGKINDKLDKIAKSNKNLEEALKKIFGSDLF